MCSQAQLIPINSYWFPKITIGFLHSQTFTTQVTTTHKKKFLVCGDTWRKSLISASFTCFRLGNRGHYTDIHLNLMQSLKVRHRWISFHCSDRPLCSSYHNFRAHQIVVLLLVEHLSRRHVQTKGSRLIRIFWLSLKKMIQWLAYRWTEGFVRTKL